MSTMQVETFECIEVDETGVPEDMAEAAALAARLGLGGQLKLATEAKDGVVRAHPFLELTREQRAVYDLLCPTDVDAKEFSAGVIPVRALKLMEQHHQHFDELRILSATQDKDPVLIGLQGSRWSGARYLMARWGEELAPWPVLVERALAKWKEQLVRESIKAKAAMDATLQALKGPVSLSDMLGSNDRQIRLYSPWSS